MELVLLTAIGVGGATVVGSLVGFLFKNVSRRLSSIILAFASGIMLAASILSLILPSIDYGGSLGIVYSTLGIFLGSLTISLLDKIVPLFHQRSTNISNPERVDRVLLFVLAIAIHNFPEGVAAGVGFGSGSTRDALMIAAGIALQNLPEGMVVISPMVAAGIPRVKALLIGVLTGVIEVVGTLIGYFAVSVAQAFLPLALSFAGGAMLFVICNEIIPETHSDGNESASTYSLIFGFCTMLVLNFYL